MAKRFDDEKQKQQEALQSLKSALREGKPQRLYIFHGEETFLLQHYLAQLKSKILDELTESFNFHSLTQENFDIQAFADAVENLPMMAERTLVHVDEVDLFKLSDAERNRAAEILSDIPDYCTVVFTYITVTYKNDKRFTKLYEALRDHGNEVEFALQEQKDLIPWIARHFAARDKVISTQLCTYLIELTGGTMTALSGEISKICAYSGAHEIKKSDIDAVTEPVLDAVIYQLTDLLGQGNYDKALIKLQQLLKMQEDPIFLLGAIGSHFRRIAAARLLLDCGKGSSELQKLAGVKEYPARKAMEAARRFRPEFCAKAAELVLDTDRKIKTSFDEPRRLLEMLVLQLAMEARNG